MGDSGRTFSVRLREATADGLERVVDLERKTARPGHKVTRNGMIELAVELFVSQRLRRVSRETTP